VSFLAQAIESLSDDGEAMIGPSVDRAVGIHQEDGHGCLTLCQQAR
jgi:hypothetical protein